MHISRRLCVASLMLALCAVGLCQDFNINGRSQLLSNRNTNFNTPLMSLRDRMHARTQAMNRFKSRPDARFESFNRPEGTESLVVSTKGNNDVQKNQDSYGRTFGEYGSYRKHTSWQKAVADDRLRQSTSNKDFKVVFPWLRNHLQRQASQGFGFDGFWNSYAFPEGGPNVPGLGPKKFAGTDNADVVPSVTEI